MHEQPLGDDLADRHARRKRAERVLEDELQLATQRAHGAAIGMGDVAPLEADDALARQEAQQRTPERRLAGAGLADDADGLALTQRQRDAVHGLEQHRRAAQEAAADAEDHLDIVALEQHRRVRLGRRLAAGRLGGQQHLGVGMLTAR